VERWDLKSLPPSTEKRRLREPGPFASRVARSEGSTPRVLFTAPECRLVVIDLDNGETLGDHQVRERAVIYVVTGRVSIESPGERAECDAGTLVVFEPNERHTLHALADAQLLLTLAPWPAAKHYTGPEAEHAHRLPANAIANPIAPDHTTADTHGGGPVGS
jgi:quercetin dioxygenase-like cupin family protein